ncbi:hypothetical protein PZ938_01200 [Luteipulveratus sp. YIM 133132]|uniref:DUF2383 domain-containing protein n=1 Tax=Luteipulveratus flavus TaxID=3031728 RepID=A0ABT6C3T7_9MICO|nr:MULTISPECIES: hypothetical protein [unclassified Luteipulveratus]MDE9364212.1 hypothetical protein [Luteipulveratus sp. YIM 133132]MDF8263626.1 hypothetical protein [Luteipulveratus sp. YIM 133296]
MTLAASLLDEQRRPAVVADLAATIDTEVSEKKGLSGTAIKAAYGTAKKVRSDIAASATDRMLPEIATALEPFWVDFGGVGDFGGYLAGRGDEAADALLAVTDRRAEATDRDVLRKAYGSLRGKAHDNVKAALPRVGAVVQKHAA